jgi:thiol-disulfide isomerase/thioredoxin
VTLQDVDTVRASGPYHVLVITEPWCGDSLAIFPVVARLFTEAGCDVRVVRRDEHPELIDQYLTNGGRAIPLILVMDETLHERFHWGPRPREAQDLVLKHKEDVAAGRMDKADVHKLVRAFYARNHGQAIVSELLEHLAA